MRALTPESLTESTMYSPRSSGISLTEACAESRATNCWSEPFSEKVMPATSAPRLGQNASLMSPCKLERAAGLLLGEALDVALVAVRIEGQRENRGARHREDHQPA